jgi:CYTH domain-containing protein
VRQLVANVDIVIENFRPGTLEKWGLGWEQLRAIKPSLIMVRISGYGQDGPYSARPGFAAIAECMGGLRYTSGFPDRPPVRVGVSLGDTLASLYGTIGALMAMHHLKVNSGQGQFIEVLEDVTMDQYHDLIKKAFKCLTKKRYVHECNGLKFEIDSIDGIELVMLEVELEHIDQPITFPDEIAKQIVGEVTGIKGFSNFALATEQ